METSEALKVKTETILIAINIKPLEGKEFAPPLELEKEYQPKEIFIDKKGFPHFNVGLVSKLNWISSFETGEILPNSHVDGTHWCHPSRFKIKE